ncbi:MAG: indole-3-glycerol phosphate synthase TrpC [Treponema sp.]|jgi:indole-3-glycerol phosphate synthase|nr:indole-3-glycerol phosphate synthase TrpC [Treponema sp.]
MIRNFMDEIAARTRLRVAGARERLSLSALRETALSAGPPENPPPFERALAGPGFAFICEVKKASPSKGLIAADFPYVDIAREYEAAGAAAVSVLTEPEYFLGSDRYLKEIAAAISLPVLRKDFIVDEYQIFEAKTLGAAAVLLICALLDAGTLMSFIKTAGTLGLSALVEVHDGEEIAMAVDAGARIIGINNRNLQTFEVDQDLSVRLRDRIPPEIIVISESGIKTPGDITALARSRINGALIGESLMRAPDKKQYLAELGCPAMPDSSEFCGG